MTENTSTPARILSDWEINQYATFYPHREAADENGTTSHPCIEIGGDANGDGAMQAYVYAEDGKLVVSLHYDTAGPDENGNGPWAYYGPDRNLIPTVVIGGDGQPVWQATAEVNPDGEGFAAAVLAAYRRGWHDRGEAALRWASERDPQER